MFYITEIIFYAYNGISVRNNGTLIVGLKDAKYLATSLSFE